MKQKSSVDFSRLQYFAFGAHLGHGKSLSCHKHGIRDSAWRVQLTLGGGSMFVGFLWIKNRRSVYIMLRTFSTGS